ncbi:MAG: hypothetical protein MK538_13365 [Planctomycetes bacterium]|nr:hypothetical protein [Planctomycetota bacterium]
MGTAVARIKSIAPLFLVADLKRSTELYANKFSFDLLFPYENFYTSVARDGHEICFKCGKRSLGGTGALSANCSVEGVGVLYERGNRRSAEDVQSRRDMPYGRKSYISDPDGDVLGFVESR